MTVFTGKRFAATAAVAAVAAIGATSGSAAAAVPSAAWYWTMAVSPADSNVLVLGTSSGLYRSADGGKTWQPTGPKGLDATSVVQAGSSLLAGGVSLGPDAGPIVKNSAGRAAPNGPGVLVASSDGGKTWRQLHPPGLPDVSVQALAVNPASTTTLYVLLDTGALYRSADGARSFRLVASKIGIPPWALAVTQGARFVGGDMDSGPHTSANGKAWHLTPFTDSSGGRMVMEYAVEPADPLHLLMTSYGVEMSTDAGKTWHVALSSSVMFGPVAWAAAPSGVAYAVGFDGSLWRSEDAGKSWTRVL